MKQRIRAIWWVAALALMTILGLTAGVRAGDPVGIAVDGVIEATYGPPVASDPPGDGNGNPVMDLLDLYITEDADNFYFAFTINADVTAVNWGKYVIYLDTTGDATGAPDDAWTRNVIVHDPHKPEYGLYSWVDCTYGPNCTQFWAWDGSWGQFGTLDGAALSSNGITSTLEWRIARWRVGDPAEFWCEVWSTGGSSHDNAQDTINDHRVYAYGRKLDDDVALVILNASPQSHDVTLPLAGYLPDGTLLRDALDGGAAYTVVGGRLTVPGVAGRWGSLLLLPSNLAGSSKEVAPPAVEPGGRLTYSLNLRNDGPGRATVVLTDLLPAGIEVITPALPVELIYDADGHRLLGQEVLSAGGALLWQVPARARADAPAGVATNTLWLEDGLGTVLSRTAGVTILPRPTFRSVYLPVILKDHE